MLRSRANSELTAALWACFLAVTFSSNSRAQEPPSTMIDFDRQVGFAEPRLITMHKAFKDDNMYYLMPNEIHVLEIRKGVPDVTLLYNQRVKRAFLSVTAEIAIDPAKVDAAVAEIKKQNHSAKFAVLDPASSFFRIVVPGMTTGPADVEAVKQLSSNRVEIMFSVPDVTTRILLIPGSYKFDIFSIVYSATYRGVGRDDDGKIRLVNRAFEIGATVRGACVFAPERYVNWATEQNGCIFPDYPDRMIRKIQVRLKEKGFYKGPIDGDFTPAVHDSIKRYQRSINVAEDGIPTPELENI
jgi:hypothetical protein